MNQTLFWRFGKSLYKNQISLYDEDDRNTVDKKGQ